MTSAPEQPQSHHQARTKVLAVTELLEAILLQLRPLDLLRAQSVCTRWRTVSVNSISIRRALWLEPAAEKTRLQCLCNPLIPYHKDPVMGRSSVEIRFTMHNILRVEAICRAPEASLRRVLMWQPQPGLVIDGRVWTKVSVCLGVDARRYRHSHDARRTSERALTMGRVESEDGAITVGQLVTYPFWKNAVTWAAEAQTRLHRTWENKVRRHFDLEVHDSLPAVEEIAKQTTYLDPYIPYPGAKWQLARTQQGTYDVVPCTVVLEGY